jgi:hypothetical protein
MIGTSLCFLSTGDQLQITKGGASKGPAEIIGEETMKLLDSIAFFLFSCIFLVLN